MDDLILFAAISTVAFVVGMVIGKISVKLSGY